MITVRIPRPSSMLLVNLLGLAGLLGIAAAVGGLTHNGWWALAVASVEAVFLSVVAATHQAEELPAGHGADPGAHPATAPADPAPAAPAARAA